MPEGNPLAIFAPGLNALGVPWMAVGSIASSAYGERRSTLDLDVVAVVRRHDAGRFLAAFQKSNFTVRLRKLLRPNRLDLSPDILILSINIRFIKPTFILQPEVRLNAGLLKIVGH